MKVFKSKWFWISTAAVLLLGAAATENKMYDVLIHDNYKLSWGDDHDFGLKFDTATGRLQLVDGAANVLGYFTDDGTSGTFHGAVSLTTPLTDADISDTLTASIFHGTGSTTDAVDLGTPEAVGTLPAANVGNGLTDAQVSDTITVGASGSVNDAALSANVPRLNATNAFTGSNTHTQTVGANAATPIDSTQNSPDIFPTPNAAAILLKNAATSVTIGNAAASNQIKGRLAVGPTVVGGANLYVTHTTSAKSVSSITESSGTATVNCTGHGFKVGEWVTLSGCTGVTSYNSTWQVQTVATDSFTITVKSGVGNPGGTITATSTASARIEDVGSSAPMYLIPNFSCSGLNPGTTTSTLMSFNRNSGHYGIGILGNDVRDCYYVATNSGAGAAVPLDTIALVVNCNNRVGIMNTNPSYPLDVTGDVRFSGNLYSAGNQIVASNKLSASQITGVIPIANLATGTPTGAKFIRDDGALATGPVGGGLVMPGTTTNKSIITSDGTTGTAGLDNPGFLIDTGVLKVGNAAISDPKIAIEGNDAGHKQFTIEENGGTVTEKADAGGTPITIRTINQSTGAVTQSQAVTFSAQAILNGLGVLTDPGANTLYGWDDTDNASKNFTIGSGLGYTHGTHTLAASLLGLEALTAPGTNRLIVYDQTDGSFQWLTIGDGLTYTHATHTVSAANSLTGTTGVIQLTGANFNPSILALDAACGAVAQLSTTFARGPVYADGSSTGAFTSFHWPPDYNGGSVTVEVVWSTASASGNSVVWKVYLACEASGVSLLNDLSFTANSNSATSANTGTKKTNIASVSLTPAAAAADTLGTIYIERTGADGSDTLAVSDVTLAEVAIKYTRS